MPRGKKARKTGDDSEEEEEEESGEDFVPDDKAPQSSSEEFEEEEKPKKEPKAKSRRGKKAAENLNPPDGNPEPGEGKSPRAEEESAKKEKKPRAKRAKKQADATLEVPGSNADENLESKDVKSPQGEDSTNKETKPKAKRGKKNAEPVPEEPVVPETTTEEVQNFIKSNPELPDLSHALLDLFKNSSTPRDLINSAVSVIFQIVESEPTRFEWGKNLIRAIFNEHMDPRPKLKEAHFFPNPTSEAKLIKHLLSAKKKMIICVFALTNNNMADAIRQAKANGVDIRLIFDDEMMKVPGSDVKALYDEGYPLRVDLDPKAHMHNKFVVIDDRIVITGSYNWTKQATNKNNENVAIFEDQEIADMYTQEFNRLWDDFASSVDQHLGGVPKEAKVDA